MVTSALVSLVIIFAQFPSLYTLSTLNYLSGFSVRPSISKGKKSKLKENYVVHHSLECKLKLWIWAFGSSVICYLYIQSALLPYD